MIISIIFSINYLNKTCNEFVKITYQMEDEILGNNWDKGYNLSVEMLDKWKKKMSLISVFIDHAEIDNINAELYKLTQYTKCETKDEALASLHNLRILLEHIPGMEKVNFQNIL